MEIGVKNKFVPGFVGLYEFFVSFIFFVFSSAAIAEGQISAGNVTLILLYEGHSGVLVKHTNLADPDNCGRGDYFILPDSHSHFKEAYSLMLSAQMAGKKVGFTVSGCHQGIPAIKHITIS